MRRNRRDRLWRIFMSDEFVGTSNPQGPDILLAQWFYQVLTSGQSVVSSEQIPVGEDVSLLGSDYHAAFYPVIPNFARALLQHEPDLLTHYGSLLFHLIGCPTCHRAYLETYDALRVALAGDTLQNIHLAPVIFRQSGHDLTQAAGFSLPVVDWPSQGCAAPGSSRTD